MSDFTHRGYTGLLVGLRNKGFSVGSFNEFPPTGPAVILRHDIDFSIAKAMEMAELESKIGIHSTFFVLMTAPYYNVLSEDSGRRLRKISGLGHEIGLHYDCSLFDGLSPVEMNAQIHRDAKLLESIAGQKVRTIAQHKPSTTLVRPVFPDFRDAYSPKYTKEIAYVSDSRMKLGVDDLNAFFATNPRSQFLVHPIWWNERLLSRAQVFDGFKSQLGAYFAEQIDGEIQLIESYFLHLSQVK